MANVTDSIAGRYESERGREGVIDGDPCRIGHSPDAPPQPQPQGDLPTLNWNRLILDSLGAETLTEMVRDYLDLLGTSVAVYERNGDCAAKLVSSAWCRFMDAASRALAPEDPAEALASGKWHCHESRWAVSRIAIETGQPVALPCKGGIHLYATPIRAGGAIIGSLSIGYGAPPTDPQRLRELSAAYQVPAAVLAANSSACQVGPALTVETARQRSQTAAKLIGVVVERGLAERRLRDSQARLALQNRILHTFLTVPDEDMYGEVVKLILEVMKSKYGVFGYLTEGGDLVVPSMTRTVWDQCQMSEKTIRFPRSTWGNSIWCRAIRERRLLYSNEPSVVPEGHVPITRNISLPILFKGEAVGIFEVANKDSDYDNSDTALLAHIAEFIAPVLHARLERDRERTARDHFEEQLQALNAALEQRVAERTAANQELEAFTYTVAHDLRSPLRHIDGFAKLLVDECGGRLAEEGRHYLERVREGTRQMGRLVDDLLSLSRLGRQGVRPEPTDLGAVVQEAVADLRAESEGRTIEWKIASLPVAKCDPGLVKVLFDNLLSNAVKFTRSRPRALIEVGIIQTPATPTFYVRDNGIGFSMKYVDKLFMPFQRLHRAEDFEGTGIGLATVKRVVHKHGGRVWTEADVEKGACFYFTLGPIEEGEPTGLCSPGKESDVEARSGDPAGGR